LKCKDKTTPSTYEDEHYYALSLTQKPFVIILAPNRELCLQLLQTLFQLTFGSSILCRAFVGGNDLKLQLKYF
jgi:superfamily II DNA/RNA helicase